MLLIDNELHKSTIAFRIPLVAEAMDIAERDYKNQIEVVSLRGHLQDLHEICRGLESFKKGDYDLIILDALYRAYPIGHQENDNGAGAALFNSLDVVADRLDAAWILIHHASKGEQAGKAVTDVGAGAGSHSRAVDTHLIFREHEEPGCIAMEAAIRSSPDIEPLVLRWSHPCWHPADELDARKLKKRRSSSDEKRDQADEEGIGKIIAALAGGERKTPREMRDTGIGRERLEKLLGRLILSQRLVRESTVVRGNQTFIYELSEPDDEF